MHLKDNTPQPRSGVEQLDAFLNARVLTAATDVEMKAAWDVKIAIKRELGTLLPEDVDRAACRLLARLLAKAEAA